MGEKSGRQGLMVVTVAVRAPVAASRALRMIRRFTSGSQEPGSSTAWLPSLKARSAGLKPGRDDSIRTLRTRGVARHSGQELLTGQGSGLQAAHGDDGGCLV